MDNDPIYFLICVAGTEPKPARSDRDSFDRQLRDDISADARSLRYEFARQINLWRWNHATPPSGEDVKILKVTASTLLCRAMDESIFGAEPAVKMVHLGKTATWTVSLPGRSNTDDDFPFHTVVAGTGIVPVSQGVSQGKDYQEFIGDAQRTRSDVATMLAHTRLEAAGADCSLVAMILPSREFSEAIRQLLPNDRAPLRGLETGNDVALYRLSDGRLTLLRTSKPQPKQEIIVTPKVVFASPEAADALRRDVPRESDGHAVPAFA